MRRNNWGYLIILILLVGTMWVARNKPEWIPSSKEATPTAEIQTFAISAASSDVTDIIIESADNRITHLKRGGLALWSIEKPGSGVADPALAEAAASQVTALLVLNKLGNIPDLTAVGLDKPNYIITIKLKGTPSQSINIGAQTTTKTGYYASLDGNEVVILSASGIEALTNLLDNPPFLAPTSTPAP